MSEPTIRPARPEDADAIAAIWSAGWPDGHLGNVPDTLLKARPPESFTARAPEHIPHATVATVEGEIAGFIMVVEDEVEQVYVAASHRGSAVATTLLAEAEHQVAANGHAKAWLAVVPGNARARAFYERCGWADEGTFEHEAESTDGPITVPAQRYTKRLHP